MGWIIGISAFLTFMFVGLAFFSWRNVKRSLKPNTVTLEREIESNKKRGFWMDFDSYNKVEYEIKGKNGYILHAMFVDNEAVRGTGRYVILCHGHTNNRYGSVKYLHCFMKLGFSCIIYDARHHGLNEPDICTMGNIESDDLKCVIDDTRARYPDIRILGLHGESLGGASTITSLNEKPEVDFVVSDCAFAGIEDVLKDGYRKVHIPMFLVDIADIGTKIRYKTSYKNMRPINSLKDNEIPILFIHGAEDEMIPPKNSEAMAAETKGYSEYHAISGAGHAESVLKEPELYKKYVEVFLKQRGY